MQKTYPKYRISQWINTSEEALAKPQATIFYGVQIRPEKGAKFMHCHRDNEPLIFDTVEKASEAIAELKAAKVAAVLIKDPPLRVQMNRDGPLDVR